MIRNHKVAAAIAGTLALGVVAFTMWTRHATVPTTSQHVRADVAQNIDEEAIAKVLRSNKLGIADLSVRSAGGIVILRGTGDAESKQQAGAIVKSLGVARVANLITAPATFDDEAIRREAERELASTSSLDGCILKVNCRKGVLSVTGTVQNELQKDAARAALKAIRGAREVRVDLSL
jgi:osmotically-inducible protein OsmY